MKEFIEELVKILFRELAHSLQKASLERHYKQQINQLEKQLSHVLKKQNLTFAHNGETYSFHHLEKGKMVFQKGKEELKMSPRDFARYQDQIIKQPPNPSPMKAPSKLHSDRQDRSGSNIDSPQSTQVLRGRLEANWHLQRVGDKEIVVLLQQSVQQAQSTHRPLSITYHEQLQQKVDQAMHTSRSNLIQQAEVIQQDMSSVKKNIQRTKELIALEREQLQDRKLKISSEMYAMETKFLERREDRLFDQWTELREMEDRMEGLIKTELQGQYPELKVEELTFQESLDIAKTAQKVPEEGLDAVRTNAEKNQLDPVIDAMDKAQGQEVVEETAIEETMLDESR